MSPIGHSLVGAAIGVAVIPREMQPKKQASVLVAFIVLANLPDFSLLFWGTKGYIISHSLYVNLVLSILVAILLRSFHSIFPQITSWRVIGGGAMSCLSHLLLDSFYNHGFGIPVFWPLSNAHLALPLPWFGHWPVTPPFITWETLRVSIIEFIFFFPLLLAALACRYLSAQWRRNRDAKRD